MSEMLFLSEFMNTNRTAWVCKCRESNDYVVIGYIDGLEKSSQIYLTQDLADDAAEDWVFSESLGDGDSSTK